MKISHPNSRKQMTMKEFSALHGLPYHTFFWRIKNGYSALEAVFMTRSEIIARRITRGQSESATYVAWQSMISRCKSHKTYLRRGITVCDRWARFEHFFEDMGVRPDGMTLDRRDNNLGYSKDNCRWADMKTQSRNTSRNVMFTFNGKTQCLAAWEEEVGISAKQIKWRIDNGFSDAEVLFGRPYVRKRS